MPIVECTINKSKDGKLLVHKTTITHIKPVAYYEAVINSEGAAAAEVLEQLT